MKVHVTLGRVVTMNKNFLLAPLKICLIHIKIIQKDIKLKKKNLEGATFIWKSEICYKTKIFKMEIELQFFL